MARSSHRRHPATAERTHMPRVAAGTAESAPRIGAMRKNADTKEAGLNRVGAVLQNRRRDLAFTFGFLAAASSVGCLILDFTGVPGSSLLLIASGLFVFAGALALPGRPRTESQPRD